MRMGPFRSAMVFSWDGDLQTCAEPGLAVDAEPAANGDHALLDHGRALSLRLNFLVREVPLEIQAAPVVVDHELPVLVARPEPHDAARRPRVLAHVGEGLLHHAGQLAAHARGEVDLVHVAGAVSYT